MKPTKAHVDRVKSELIAVGVTKYGLLKTESRHLPAIIHEDEHIGGVVYGQYEAGSGMLIATDHRIIFLDHKPLFVTMDELTYDVVSGVSSGTSGLLHEVTLHTRVSNYTMRYVNAHCADTFVHYIEKMRLEKNKSTKAPAAPKPQEPSYNLSVLDSHTTSFLASKDLGVLTTVDRTGNMHGTPVYYVYTEQNVLYFVSKQDTKKVRNIRAQSSASFTVFDEPTLKTLSMQGQAYIETDQTTKDSIYSYIVRPRVYNGETRMPPVAYLREGAFTVLRFEPLSADFRDYSQM